MMKEFIPLRGIVNNDPCPDALKMKDNEGEFYLLEPCGHADCKSPECQKRAKLKEIASVPDVFPEELHRKYGSSSNTESLNS